MCSTYVAIQPTCPDSCAFKGSGCFVEEGFTGWQMARMNLAARRLTGLKVIEAECRAIARAFGGGRIPQDGACGGRDMRIHVGGDAHSEARALLLAWEIDRWLRRGGGLVWTFTHLWQVIMRASWGPISALASVDHVSEIPLAVARGYVPALVVPSFPSRKAFSVPGWDGKLVPCPAETTGRVTCVECRLCLDDSKLKDRNLGIAFEAHGPGAVVAANALVRHK